jgi:23S rRNA (adenine2030-N6)-methyltransferase
MNYRHGYHAGNFADMAKHSLLTVLLDALNRKPAPWHYFDTHAGAGAYDLGAEDARRTGEAQGGILRLWAARGGLPAALERLCAVVGELNPGLAPGAPPRIYPGSPRVAAALARDADRLTLAELHPVEARALKAEFQRDQRTAVHQRDGYEMLKALTPPPERRGLTLLDPPYESPEEFAWLVETVTHCHGRWPGGIYALWYPIKDEPARKRFLRSMERSGLRRILLTEFRLGPQADTLAGSGLLVVNPPWQADGEMRACLEALVRVLAPDRGGSEVGWLVPE